MSIDVPRPLGGNQCRLGRAQDESVGAGTKVTWAMQGKKPFIGKLMGLFMDCEKMCGDDFEKGLANLAKLIAGGTAAK